MPLFSKHKRRARWPVLVALVLVGALGVLLAGFLLVRLSNLDGSGLSELRLFVTPSLPRERAIHDIPANRWVKLQQDTRADWHRQRHGGAVYDSLRGRLMLFGSDTHGLDWDNRIHVFDPDLRAWDHLREESAPSSYRRDAERRAIAGDAEPMPWAMHTYDMLIYDAARDDLVVAARPDHTPTMREMPPDTRYPPWRYDIGKDRWQMLDDQVSEVPRFFAGAAAYDVRRDTLVVYASGIWEMGPSRDRWVLASGESPHQIHQAIEYDTRRGIIAVFGNHRPTNAVWIYTPGPAPGAAGTWEQRQPSGDVPPPGQTLPVAYDTQRAVFLLIVDDPPGVQGRARAARTYVYDPAGNRYTELPDANLDVVGMNYNLVYDSKRGVFLLVTAGRRLAPVVWVLRLVFPAASDGPG